MQIRHLFPATRALALAAPCLAALAFSAGPARAGDDGEAPLWVGVGSIFGFSSLTGGDDKPSIDYREHGRIVLPPKIALPPPGSPTTANSGSWPADPDVQRAKQEKAKAKAPIQTGPARRRNTGGFDVTPDTVVTMRATAGQGPGGSCAGGRCATTMMPSIDPLGMVGLGKKKTLGPEPDREWLTDPPKGYRAPVGVGGADDGPAEHKSWKERMFGSAFDVGSH